MKIKTRVVSEGVSVSLCEIASPIEISDAVVYHGLHHQAENVRSENRRHEIITEGVMVKELFGENVSLAHRESGAPYLVEKGEEVGTNISISHCEGLVAVAHCRDRKVGVDVEVVSDRVMRVRDRVLSADEIRFAGSSVVLNTLTWTAKEALFKLIPETGVDFRADLHLDLSSLDGTENEKTYEATAYGRSYRMLSWFENGRCVTVVTD